jgi:phage gp29-like protein
MSGSTTRRLLGPDGQPIDPAAIAMLRQEIGGAVRAPGVLAPERREERSGIVAVRQVWQGNPAANLSPARLASILRAADQGDGLAYLELAEEVEERDLHYSGVLGTRKRQVSQLPLTVEAASDDPEHVRHADFLRDWLREGVLDEVLFDLLDAIPKGFSIAEIIWRTDPGAILPERLVYRPQRWFEVDRTDGETLSMLDGSERVVLPPHKFVVHRHPNKSGLLLRSGLARLALWGWLFKAFTMKDWATFAQNYGQPVRIGRYGPEATDADKDVLWRAVANIAGDCAAIVPKGMEIEFVESKNLSDGSELYLKRVSYLDQQISKAVLGQTATTDAIAGGHAIGHEHRLVQEDIERADARMLAGTLTRQLFRAIVSFNFGPQARYPTARIGRPDEVPIGTVVDALHKLVPLGLRVEASQVRDRLGLEEPAEGSEVLALINAAPPPETPPPPPQSMSGLRRLVALQAVADGPDLVERLTARMAQDAAGAMAGMTAEIRAEVDAATDMADLVRRLSALNLDSAAFAEAMGRGLVLAQLAGQAALLDEIAGRG